MCFCARMTLPLGVRPAREHSGGVDTVKDTQRATVRLSYDGKVYKIFRGPKAEERFANEVKVLRYLQKKDCPFVPILIEEDRDQLQIVTTSCGARVQHLDEARAKELFAELEEYGVRHGDIDVRNVTYRNADGRFCLIDFEFATVLHGAEAGGLRQEDTLK
jgi:tRNA A-37 threonylcarbamoyl transferase component Bud32